MHRLADLSSARASRWSSDSEEEPFAFSPINTPSEENPPFRTSNPRYAMDRFAGEDFEDHDRHSQHESTVTRDLSLSPSSKSRPIDIELPKGRRREPSFTSTYTPTAPLSARGDISGGYFPLHEDPSSRVRAPHPFQADIEMARRSSLQRAAEDSRRNTGTRSSRRRKAPSTSKRPRLKQTTSSASPYTSYMPSGLHNDVALPLGKYYPSNYEKRHGKNSNLVPSTTVKPAAPVVTKSEPQVPRVQGEHRPSRPDLDVKQRLQQYQRDMVTQTAMAATAVLANSTSKQAAHFAATFLKAHKPLSPRLQPLGSPEVPITPMSLEDESYLTLGSPATGIAAQPQTMGTGDAVRPGEKKRQRKKSHSPSVGLSVVSV
jgi:hypothetical protein